MNPYINPHDTYHMRSGKKDFLDLEIPLPDSWHKMDFETVPVVQYRFMTEDQGTRLWGRNQKDWEEFREFYREQVHLYDSHLTACRHKHFRLARRCGHGIGATRRSISETPIDRPENAATEAQGDSRLSRAYPHDGPVAG
jgi:hypothetical protein